MWKAASWSVSAEHHPAYLYYYKRQYRNSMMTSVLRDSLGGNCRTVMVATVSTERAHTAESISTCRCANACAHAC